MSYLAGQLQTKSIAPHSELVMRLRDLQRLGEITVKYKYSNRPLH